MRCIAEELDRANARSTIAALRHVGGCQLPAACRAKSRADFVNKLRIVEEECDESLFWMELLADNDIMKISRLQELMREGDELVAIIVASTKTAASNAGRANRQSPIANLP